MQAPPVLSLPKKPRPVLWRVLGIFGTCFCCLFVFSNFLAPAILGYVTQEKLDWEGKKGVSEYEKMSGLKLPSGTTCLAGHYSQWLDWRYDFLFRSAKPILSPDLPKVDSFEESIRLDSLKSNLKQFDKPFKLLHPRNLRQKDWQQKDASWVSITSVECDDGYYLFGSVFST